MRKLLTTLLPYRNYLKQSNLDKKILTTMLLPLTTSYYLCAYKSFLCIMFVQIVVFMYNVFSMYQCYCSLFAHLINKASKMYKICL